MLLRCSALLAVMMTFLRTEVPAQTSVGTNFHAADSVAEHFAAHPLTDLKGLSFNLTRSLHTDREKFRAIYRWVCNNIAVDLDLVALQRRKRQRLRGAEAARWNAKFNRLVFGVLVRERKTVCTGYAYLVRELAIHAGIQCRIVSGHARPGGLPSTGPLRVNHSWNMVFLGGAWYPCDATWSSGRFNLTTNQFERKFNDKYFLADACAFFAEHDESAPWSTSTIENLTVSESEESEYRRP